jgi:hypothetical protein
MTREVKLYFEDAFPDCQERWHATAQNNLDVEIACGTGTTAMEALERLAIALVAARNRKRKAARRV